MAGSDDDKRMAALAAVDEVRAGMLVGLGTGSTAKHAIDALGERVAQGFDIRAVATSEASWRQASALGVPLLDMADVDVVDLTIDGADEIDPELRAIKGAGGAMLREKVVACASRRMIVVADTSKRVEQLGQAPVPVEVIPFARASVTAALRALAAAPTLRRRDGEPYRTDQGNLVIDCGFRPFPDPATLASRLDAIPGVVGHGLFLDQVDAAYIAGHGRVERIERRAS